MIADEIVRKNPVRIVSRLTRGAGGAIGGRRKTSKPPNLRAFLYAASVRPETLPVHSTREFLRPALGWFRDLAGQRSHSIQTAHRKAHQRPKVCEQRIALIFQVEFEPLGRKYRGAA